MSLTASFSLVYGLAVAVALIAAAVVPGKALPAIVSKSEPPVLPG